MTEEPSPADTELTPQYLLQQVQKIKAFVEAEKEWVRGCFARADHIEARQDVNAMYISDVKNANQAIDARMKKLEKRVKGVERELKALEEEALDRLRQQLAYRKWWQLWKKS